ncbi:hypothetical protein F8388_020963 [Cannabis sativa]|uniref:MADS-box domain-containing protein n=1 Tax=Cannabis sativa TaxID=3483 RepID=A0A7J6FKK7_CANSA|nr:hypothetical protein F8388_020963 [Cannabis sativa]
MTRRTLLLKLIPNERARRVTFSKRKSGLIKKAYELSTLCDVKVCLIIKDSTNQPSNNPIATWPKDPHKVRSLINDYKIAKTTQKPSSKRLQNLTDFLKERINKVNKEIEKLCQSKEKSKGIVLGNGSKQEKLNGDQLCEFASELDNKMKQLNLRMRHLLSSHNDIKLQMLLQQHQMTSSSSSKAPLFGMNYHNNNGSFTSLLNSNDYVFDKYYNGNGTNLFQEDQGGQHGQYYDLKINGSNNNNMLEFGGVGELQQNDENVMSQPLQPLMPSSVVDNTEWPYNQADSNMRFGPM